MHLPDGVLSIPVLAGGALLTTAGVAYGLRRLPFTRLPQTAVMASAFFVASLIHLPVPPLQAHLVLNGLLGLVLGWAAFPAIFLALALQALLFQYGGITTLGVNTFNMALPALVCGLCLRPMLGLGPWPRICAGFLAGALGVMGSGCLTAVSVALSGEDFLSLAFLLLTSHAFIMLFEGVAVALIVNFLWKVRPQVLGLPPNLN